VPAHEMIFQLDVSAPRAKVVKAITTQKGINGWWTDTARVPTTVGATMEFSFPGMPQPFDLKLARKADDRIEWEAGSFPPPWAGTRVIWELSDRAEAPGTTVVMRHTGWKLPNPAVGVVTVGWGQIFANLRDYLETGEPSPFFVVAGG
jgi:uncharacterized protein YndB with AHSA1/START domain